MIIRLSLAMLLIASLTGARPAAAQGDPELGKELGFTCMGCHGIEGYRNAYPSFRVPRLGGQQREYLETALKAYRDGSRPHPTMQAQATAMSDDDIDNLLAWLETYGSTSDTVTAEAVAGAQAAEICVTCHGAQGTGVTPQPPILSGQHTDYLVYAMERYREGARSGNVMSAFAATLTDADIATLAKFYSAQEGLETLEK